MVRTWIYKLVYDCFLPTPVFFNPEMSSTSSIEKKKKKRFVFFFANSKTRIKIAQSFQFLFHRYLLLALLITPAVPVKNNLLPVYLFYLRYILIFTENLSTIFSLQKKKTKNKKLQNKKTKSPFFYFTSPSLLSLLN